MLNCPAFLYGPAVQCSAIKDVQKLCTRQPVSPRHEEHCQTHRDLAAAKCHLHFVTLSPVRASPRNTRVAFANCVDIKRYVNVERCSHDYYRRPLAPSQQPCPEVLRSCHCSRSCAACEKKTSACWRREDGELQTARVWKICFRGLPELHY